MPPRTRGSKTTKNLKENLGVVNKPKLKGAAKTVKPPRKALADKTNSASDDNTSVEVLKKNIRKNNHLEKQTVQIIADLKNLKTGPRRNRRLPSRFAENEALTKLLNSKENANVSLPPAEREVQITTDLQNVKARPRRNRRLPSRFEENDVLTNLSNSKDNANVSPPSTSVTVAKVPVVVISPLKTPKRSLETCLVTSRPRRICRLPSKFEDHSISPNKFIPVQPCNASTPILQKKDDKTTKLVQKKVTDVFNSNAKSTLRKDVSHEIEPKDSKKKRTPSKKEDSPNKRASDTNNNAKHLRSTRAKKAAAKVVQINKQASPVISPTKAKKIFVKNTSFRIFDDKKQTEKDNEDKLDVYEFTFDPNDEPPPQKKKKKRVTKKKPTQPKSVVFKNNYDKNVSKALASLKNAVSKKIQEQPAVDKPVVKLAEQNKATKLIRNDKKHAPSTTGTTLNNITVQSNAMQNNTLTGKEINYASIRVEDIAADFEQSEHHVDHDINYSPVNTPTQPKTPTDNLANTRCQSPIIDNNDPLNLREELSFFDENPVASSSMMSVVKHPHASPWRAEFSNLPIKWQVNTYVKPNMTPAFESSFINFENNKKKHVYTNMVPEPNESLPQIVDEPSKLKQTSIISFIKEVVERSAKKKKRGRSVTPVKANSIFEDISNVSVQTAAQTPRHNDTPNQSSGSENISNNSKNSSRGKENRKRKNNSPLKTTPAKLACKEKNKDHTFFGFDDSENLDQENVSPSKQIDKGRVQALRPRARAVLQEINSQSGPTRAVLPVATKSKMTSSDAVNKVYEELKSATDAPVFPEKNTVNDTVPETTINNDLYDDSQSVHLFEDIEVVHHLKPSRKSYGKSKKVTFRQTSLSDSDTQPTVAEQGSSDEEDRNDFTFELPTVKTKKTSKKKKTKKQKLSNKEEKELEEWAAGFNSMCEDIEEVALVVE